MKDMIYFAGHFGSRARRGEQYHNYYFSDQVASSRMLVTSTGTPCWDADYYPFGGANVLTMTSCQPVYKYAETESDSETSADLDYAMFRYYDHRFARWMSPDPLSGSEGNPQSWNGYGYVIANPLALTDPLGLYYGPCGPSPCGGGGGRGGGGGTGGGAGGGQSPNAHVTRWRVTENAPATNCEPGTGRQCQRSTPLPRPPTLR